MSEITRRQLLSFFGATAAVAALGPTVDRLALGQGAAHADGGSFNRFTPVRLPHPLPIYQNERSFLATGIGSGTLLPPAADPKLASYTVIDDVIVPPEFERYVILRWGDRVFPDAHDYVGYNCDYTAFIAIDDRNAFGDRDFFKGRNGHDDDDPDKGYLWVNHEYVSYPASRLSPGIVAGLGNSPTTDQQFLGFSFPTGSAGNAATLALRLAGLSASDRRLLYGEFYYNMGGSILLVSDRNRHQHWEVLSRSSKNRRIHGLSGLAINGQRTDAYKDVTSWGSDPHQRGDDDYLIGTGPAATEVFERINSDGLGNRIIGTAFNCSGATTPWGTIMTAEENFQGSTGGNNPFYMGVQEEVLPDGSQRGYVPASGAVITSGQEFGLVGEKYGWLVEIDPDDPDFRPRKHTALGRFRHENIALRVERDKKLVAYMGDDRRGGHTWKFVSDDKVRSETSRRNSKLLEDGTLYVARYNADGTGRWIPLTLSTPTNPLRPSDLSSVPFAAGFDDPVPANGEATLRNGRLRLPRRHGVAGIVAQPGVLDGGSAIVERDGTLTSGAIAEATAFQAYPLGYLGTTLGAFYPRLGAILCDAFHAGNLVGGTPAARAEDLEINPRNHREVFVAFTDGAPGGDGYPDSRIFEVAKLTAAVDDTQQPGGLYKIIEDSRDGTGLTFTWERLEQGGEAGADGCSGFAAVDNLVFDKSGNVWGVTDMSTGLHNGFTDGVPNNPTTINHTAIGDISNFIGVFGNNWMFVVPTSGSDAGEILPFAYGPTRCEFTGPTFVGKTLIMSIQHPGEDCDFGPGDTLSRDIEMLDLDGELFTQARTVTRSSAWPSNIETPRGNAPRPCVIGIQRKDSHRKFL
jgi:secreted PhoX family phosphatase